MKIVFEYQTKGGNCFVTGNFTSDNLDECIVQFKEIHPECIDMISTDCIRKYEITSNEILGWTCKIEIQEEKAKPFIKEMVEFWSNWKFDLDLNDGDYTKTFLEILARKILYVTIAENCNLEGIVEEISGQEGWYAIDGSCGIWIKESDDYEIECRDFSVTEPNNPFPIRDLKIEPICERAQIFDNPKRIREEKKQNQFRSRNHKK